MVPLFVIANLTFFADKPAQPRALMEDCIVAATLIIAGAALLIYRAVECKHYDPNACDLDVRLQEGRKRARLLTDTAVANGQAPP